MSRNHGRAPLPPQKRENKPGWAGNCRQRTIYLPPTCGGETSPNGQPAGGQQHANAHLPKSESPVDCDDGRRGGSLGVGRKHVPPPGTIAHRGVPRAEVIRVSGLPSLAPVRADTATREPQMLGRLAPRDLRSSAKAVHVDGSSPNGPCLFGWRKDGRTDGQTRCGPMLLEPTLTRAP